MSCPPSSTLFPYTTLFRSCGVPGYEIARQDGKDRTVVARRTSAGICRSRWSNVSWWNRRRSGLSCPLAFNSRRSEEHTSELQSLRHLVCRLLLEKKKYTI